MVFGVDEAGKGPVLGSMFAAAVGVPDPSILDDDVDDSKNVPTDRRRELAAWIRDDDRVAVGVASVSPERIDDPATDMNGLTVRVQAEAIAQMADEEGTPDDPWRSDDPRGIVDACDVDADRFARRVGEALPDGVEPGIRAEHGADERRAVVGAASIVAKDAREAHVATLAAEYGEVGSGYPSDPTTREFLREYVRKNGDLPDCARESWSTCRDLVAASEQSALGEF